MSEKGTYGRKMLTQELLRNYQLARLSLRQMPCSKKALHDFL